MVTGPYASRDIDKPTVRCNMHSKWAHEGLPFLHNSGHTATALQLNCKSRSLKWRDTRTESWGVGQVHSSYKRFECRTATLWFPRLCPLVLLLKVRSMKTKTLEVWDVVSSMGQDYSLWRAAQFANTVWWSHCLNPSDRTTALGSTQPLTERSTRNICWRVKAARV